MDPLSALNPAVAAEISGLVVVYCQLIKPFVPDTDARTAEVRALAAVLGAAMAAVGAVTQLHEPASFAVITTAVAQGSALGYAVSLGFKGAKVAVTKAVAAVKRVNVAPAA